MESPSAGQIDPGTRDGFLNIIKKIFFLNDYFLWEGAWYERKKTD
jgi:hypothetical protein